MSAMFYFVSPSRFFLFVSFDVLELLFFSPPTSSSESSFFLPSDARSSRFLAPLRRRERPRLLRRV